MKNFLISFLLVVSVGCTAQKNKNKSKPPEYFYNCWSASFEEDSDESTVKTYRLCEYKFPPRMWRPTVKFNKDGTCQVLHLGPTDIHFYVDCTWLYDKRKKRVVVYDKDKKMEMKFRIRLLEKDVMKIVSEM